MYKLLLHHQSRLRIECRERFIHQKHVRASYPGSRQGDSLFHPSRQFIGSVLLEACETDTIYKGGRGRNVFRHAYRYG